MIKQILRQVLSKRFCLMMIIGLILFSSPCFSAQSISSSLSLKTLTPQNANKIPIGSTIDMIYFELKGIGDGPFDSFENVTLENTSSTVYFGNGVNKCFIYKDDGDKLFDIESETKLGNGKTFTAGSHQLQLNDFSEEVASESATGFWIVYEIDANVQIGTTTNIEIKEINSQPITMANNEKEVTIAGLTHYSAIDIAPEKAIAGQTLIPMLKLSFKMQGDTLYKNIKIKIRNTEENYVVTENQTDGVENLYLYYIPPGIENFSEFDESERDQYIVKTISAGEFLSKSEAMVSFSADLNDPGDLTSKRIQSITTQNYFVVYDIGEDFSFSTGTSVKAQLVSLSGIGQEASMTYTKAKYDPDPAAEVNVAGLTYKDIYKVPTSETFGPGNTAPLLSVTLTPHHSTVSLNAFVINSNWVSSANTHVSFITAKSSEQGITAVKLYQDHGDQQYDGGSVDDVLIGSLELGTNTVSYTDEDELSPIAGNTPKLAVVTFNRTVQISRDAQFYVVYDIGDAISISAASKYVEAQIQDIVGSGLIEEETITINLTGSLPAVASPAASILIQNQNVYIEEGGITDIAPSKVLQGQLSVPMMHLKIKATQKISSSSIEILNDGNTFLSNHNGVNKVTIYKDATPVSDGELPVFSSDDYPVSFAEAISQINKVTISGIPLEQNENQFFLVYDIGQKVQTSDIDNIMAQMNKISGQNLVYGGSTPYQLTAKTKVAEKYFEVIQVSTDYKSTISASDEFSVNIILKNNHTSAVPIQTIVSKFYLESIDGRDISSEFVQNSINPINYPNYPTINANDTVEVKIKLERSKGFSEGSAIVDTDVKYEIDDTNSALLTRYYDGSTWSTAAPDGKYPMINVKTLQKKSELSNESYIQKIIVDSGGNQSYFTTKDIIEPASLLKIYLVNYGEGLDDTDFIVQLNGATLSRSSSQDNPAQYMYSYNDQTGCITVGNLGSSSGTIELTVNNSLPTETLEFIIEPDTLRVIKPLFYPNPYRLRSGEILKFGGYLTTDATVTLYFFNHIGRRVYSKEFDLPLGPVMESIDTGELKPGMYFCKIVAKDNNGNKVYANTKLAIY